MAALQLASVGQQGMVDRTSGDAETFPLLQSTDGDSRNGFADDIQISVHGEQEERNLTRKLVVSVTGMTCAACSTSVETALKRLPGVETAAVALIQEKAEISYNPALLKVGKNYLLHWFHEPPLPCTLHSLNLLCVLVQSI